MADSVATAGQAVRISTRPLTEDGPTLHQFYYVAEPDPAKAIEILRRVGLVTPDQEVVALRPLPQATLEALNLKPGEFTHG